MNMPMVADNPRFGSIVTSPTEFTEKGAIAFRVSRAFYDTEGRPLGVVVNVITLDFLSELLQELVPSLDSAMVIIEGVLILSTLWHHSKRVYERL